MLFRVLAATVFLLSLPGLTLAQGVYFGRNKVQYHEFDFKVLKTAHFDIYYYPEEEEATKLAAQMAERWYARLSRLLNHELRGRQPLILYASGPHFRQTNAVEGQIGEGTGGVTEAFKRRIVLPFAGPLEATDHVLGHELVHAFQYDITNTNVSGNNAGALALPLWFIEGMAEYLSIGPVDSHTAMWMREAARREQLPEIDDLDKPRYFPYRYGQAFWAFVGGRYGDRVIGDMLRVAVGRGGVEGSIQELLGVDSKQLSKEWHAAEYEAYRPIAEVTRMPAAIARQVISKERGAGHMNVSPELSPDGTKVMFFSEKDLFSIDLFLADFQTGKIIRKITDTATDPHFESLQFLSSAGAWDRSSKRFVFPGISKGEPVLVLIDADRGKKVREIRIRELHEILNPTWSPDGRTIAFSGLVGGLNDLFLYDIESSSLRRLTNDPYAELDPAFSPDGRLIAFSTDRFSTTLETLQPGHLRLAVVDVGSGQVREAGGFADSKNISPQWSSDGRTLFFLSDREGITNIYRLQLDGGGVRQVTNLLTGASGITALSPALSAADGRLVFSAYENDGYNIYAIETPDVLAGGPLVELPLHAAVLPPRRTAEGPVAMLLQNPTLGLDPTPEAAPPQDYDVDMSLDFAGQPAVAVGVDPFGTYAAGGVSFVFSDMLGNHTIATGVQMTSRFDEFGGTLAYINRSKRWNWGLALDQTPYVSRAFAAGFDQNQDVFVEQEFRVLQVDRSLSGLLSYPFSNAQRVDFTGGVRQIGLKQDVTTRLYSPFTGQQIAEDRETIRSFPTLNLAESSAALVYDTSIFGVASPIRGSRYRMEVSQSAGALSYTGLLGDFRTYLMPFRPFTFAFRGLYYGRHGSDAGDERLPILYLGYPGLVRGYDSGSFDAFECGAAGDGSCPIYDRLIGSRVGVFNAELRFPLWGAFGGDNFYGPLPIEMAVFADAGKAWGSISNICAGGVSCTTSLNPLGDRDPVFSYGAAARINLLGFAVAEIDFVRPVDRPGQGWMWQFSLRPGF